MGRLRWSGVLGGAVLLGLALVAARSSGADTRCNRSCAPELRDAKGCCPAKTTTTTKTTKTTKTATKTTKTAKTIKTGPTTVATTGTGTATTTAPETAKVSCPDGLVAAATQCCWPGQRWSVEAAACQGEPSGCPAGLEVAGETCAVGVVASTLDGNGVAWVAFPRTIYTMGSRDGALDAQPPHRVILSPFQLSKTEITVAQYGACVKAGKCTATSLATTPASNWGKSDRATHPINDVSWEQAQSFCAWAGGRLPTEAEWELAARSGGREQPYPWGLDDATCEQAVLHDGDLAGCRREMTWPVCSRPKGSSVQGVCDLAGNVAEWVADRYARDSYTTSSSVDPTGPATGSERVVRGGGWFHPDGRTLRAFHRLKYAAELRYSFVGFRCARAAK